ncbi:MULTISPECIES: hypothetical protein [unclassified Microcoleus]|uniref:hypothetical protein n=2 Tax=unclassified Microcoleus TaxID=2642155 RepID=UPI0025F9D92A|nr:MULTISPECIES: hypothetical protein [unclassified Microcoleus]
MARKRQNFGGAMDSENGAVGLAVGECGSDLDVSANGREAADIAGLHQSFSPPERAHWLHFWGGESGGVGKSTCCRLMVHYLSEELQREDFCAIDCDRTKPDVSNWYGSQLGERCTTSLFSESEELSCEADAIIEKAMVRDAIVNLPAQAFDSFKEWARRNALADVVKELGIIPVMWFVSDGTLSSLTLFGDSMREFGSWMRHVWVRNYGREKSETAWHFLEERPEFANLKPEKVPLLYAPTEIEIAGISDFDRASEPGFFIMNVPAMYAPDRKIFEEEQKPLKAVAETLRAGKPLFSIRSRKFLSDTCIQFDRVMARLGAKNEKF